MSIQLPQPDAYEYLIAGVWRSETHWNGVKANDHRRLYATKKMHAHAAAVSAADNAALREVLEMWSGDGSLQTFEDRERFRKAARKAIGNKP